MSEKLVEKKLLSLLLLSLVLHVALFWLVLHLPEEKRAVVSEPFMVDLEDLKLPPLPGKASPPVQRQAEIPQRVEREVAPKGEAAREKPAPSPAMPVVRGTPPPEQKSVARPPAMAETPVRERSSRDELFRKRAKTPAVPGIDALYPGAAKMARLEEGYRKKYGPEVAEGETRFLNLDDIQFGSFLRRFETAVYGVWTYPPEAAKLGIEGLTPVKITFNRSGKIIATELLQSSGSKILDNEVLRTLGLIGPLGSFPKGYDKETFNLIAFFHYGITQGAVRSLH